MKIVKGILFLLLIFGCINHTNAGYKYPYICDDFSCNETYRGNINSGSNGHYLMDESFQSTSNFSNFLQNKLDYYANYYDDNEFTIDNLCVGTGSNVCDIQDDVDITLRDFLNMSGEIKIGDRYWVPFKYVYYTDDTYESGVDYLFSNFSDIINELHVGLPNSQKPSSLSHILKNISWYDKSSNRLRLNRVCRDGSCHNSDEKNIRINDTSDYKFLNGTIKHNSTFKLNTFVVSNNYNISSYDLKAGESLDFNFGFEDYLDADSFDTEYEYRIYYNYKGQPTPDYNDYFLKEVVKVQGGDHSSDYKFTSDTIIQSNLDKLIDLTILDKDNQKIRLGIREGIKLNISGEVNFYLAVKNLNTGDSFDITKINPIPVTVYPSDDIRNGSSSITSLFNKPLNDVGFNVGDTFTVKLDVSDKFGNEHYDTINGYNVALADGSSDFIELSKWGSSTYSKTLSGVKTTTDTPYYIVFKFRITQAGYHDLAGFNVTVREKLNYTTYTLPAKYFELKDIIPLNLFDSGQLMKIFIKSQVISDINIACGRVVNIQSLCKSDNFSGCNNSADQNVSFNRETDNGTTGTLSIKDYAFNVKNYNYTMNHVDRSAPVIVIEKNGLPMLLDSYNFKANSDSLELIFSENSTINCSNVIKYTVRLNGVDMFTGLEAGSSKILIDPTFFESSGSKELYVKSEDEYGNIYERTIDFMVYPSDLDNNYSSVYLTDSTTKDTKAADGLQEYVYYLNLRDKYNNPIYNKNINLINHDCSAVSGCESLKVNMRDYSGDDAMLELGYGGTTNASGILNFRIKSYAPGSFQEYFMVTMDSWDNNYSNIGSNQTEYIGSLLDYNSYKRLFSGEVTVSNSGSLFMETIPEIGTKQFYKLKVNKLGDINIGLFPNFNQSSGIVPLVTGHVFRDFSKEKNNFNVSSGSDVIKFEARVDATANFLDAPRIGSDLFALNYSLLGKTIKTYLTANELGSEHTEFSVSGLDEDSLGLKVIGSLQGDGRSSDTGQEENFSDLYKSNSRLTIRSNAYKLIQGLSSGDISQGIKYIEGDYELSSNEPSYKTLIVKNGNVIISGDINNTQGIIVLKDNYNVNGDYNNKGNVYIRPNVSYINSYIYADGGFISVNSNNIPINDGANRRSILSNQLVLFGSLFTRNTIGGAVLGSQGEYYLPGGQGTSDYNNSMIYDLNYIRTNNNNPVGAHNQGFNHPFIIKYNQAIQTNPLPGFKQ